MTNVQPLSAGESLAPGDEGEQVLELQRKLTHLGHYQGRLDGWYGDATETAVREFQGSNGQTEDGRTEVETWETLEREAESNGYDPYAQTPDPQPEPQADNPEVGSLSEDGKWRWDGSDWVAAETAAETAAEHQEAQPEVGQLSPDGAWRWDGEAWQPAAEDQLVRPGDADPMPLSEDGKWRWDGEQWQPVDGAAEPPDATQPDGSAPSQPDGTAPDATQPDGAQPDELTPEFFEQIIAQSMQVEADADVA